MATSFSTGLNLSPITFNEPSSNAARYGNAVDLGKIWKTNRGQSFSPSDFIAQDIANKSAVETAASNADAYAMAKSLGSIGLVSAGEKEAKQKKADVNSAASKSMWGDGLGAVLGIGGTLLGGPAVGMLASKGGQMLGNAIG